MVVNTGIETKHEVNLVFDNYTYSKASHISVN